jgi:hypothetical protein
VLVFISLIPNSFLKNVKDSELSYLDGRPDFKSISTLNVIRHPINLYISPTIIILEQGGQKILKLSSIGTGAMFSPPAPIISSLIRPVIFKWPSFKTIPRSPLLINP